MTTLDRVHEKFVHAKAIFVTDLETAVVKATKRNSKAPKWKHVSVLLNATWRRDISISDIGFMLSQRLKDTSWSVVFKTLILIHLLMEQGSNDRLIGFLATQPTILNLAGFRDASGVRVEQSKNIQRYAAYLEEKVHVYRELKRDYCRPSSPIHPNSTDAYGSINAPPPSPHSTDQMKMMKLSPISLVFLSDLGVLIRQLSMLVKANFYVADIDNNVTLAAFKLLLQDLLMLYQLINEGLINFLKNIKSLSISLAKKGIEVFRQFLSQTSAIDRFLKTAREIPPQILNSTIPEFKHIPDIADSLERELELPQPFATSKLQVPSQGTSSKNADMAPTISFSSAPSSIPTIPFSSFQSTSMAVNPYQPTTFEIASSQVAPLSTQPTNNTTIMDLFDPIAMRPSSFPSAQDPFHTPTPSTTGMTSTQLSQSMRQPPPSFATLPMSRGYPMSAPLLLEGKTMAMTPPNTQPTALMAPMSLQRPTSYPPPTLTPPFSFPPPPSQSKSTTTTHTTSYPLPTSMNQPASPFLSFPSTTPPAPLTLTSSSMTTSSYTSSSTQPLGFLSTNPFLDHSLPLSSPPTKSTPPHLPPLNPFLPNTSYTPSTNPFANPSSTQNSSSLLF